LNHRIYRPTDYDSNWDASQWADEFMTYIEENDLEINEGIMRKWFSIVMLEAQDKTMCKIEQMEENEYRRFLENAEKNGVEIRKE